MKWLSANELEKLNDMELEEYRDELVGLLAMSDPNFRTIVVATIRVVEEMLSRRQRPWLWETNSTAAEGE
jgi:hypothetical protein